MKSWIFAVIFLMGFLWSGSLLIALIDAGIVILLYMAFAWLMGLASPALRRP